MCGSVNKPPMEEIARLYEKETGTSIRMIFGGSGTLLSQVEMSQRGDVYLPGSPDYIIKAKRKKLIYPYPVEKIAYLVSAIIVPKGNPAGIRRLSDLAKPGVKVGIGNPEAVCLGLYAIELLEKNNLLEEVMKNVVTYGGSCSWTANLVALGSVDAIIGWRVFHFWNPKKMEYIRLLPEEVPRISYIPVSIPVYAKERKESERFINFILSEKGKSIYRKWGYIVDREEAGAYSTSRTIGGEYTLPKKYFDLIRGK